MLMSYYLFDIREFIVEWNIIYVMHNIALNVFSDYCMRLFTKYIINIYLIIFGANTKTNI